jgi:hypothetical protein
MPNDVPEKESAHKPAQASGLFAALDACVRVAVADVVIPEKSANQATDLRTLVTTAHVTACVASEDFAALLFSKESADGEGIRTGSYLNVSPAVRHITSVRSDESPNPSALHPNDNAPGGMAIANLSLGMGGENANALGLIDTLDISPF